MNPERVPESELLRTWREELEARGRKEGQVEMRAEGLGHALLVLLASRQIAVEPPATQRIRACRDPEQLERWLVRATTASSLQDVLDG